MCPLQIINDIKHISLTLYGLNGTFIHHPSNVENYSNGHKLETGQPQIFFYTSLQIFGSKFEIPIATEIVLTFWTPAQSALNGPPNSPMSIWSKIQNRLSRAS